MLSGAVQWEEGGGGETKPAPDPLLHHTAETGKGVEQRLKTPAGGVLGATKLAPVQSSGFYASK